MKFIKKISFVLIAIIMLGACGKEQGPFDSGLVPYEGPLQGGYQQPYDPYQQYYRDYEQYLRDYYSGNYRNNPGFYGSYQNGFGGPQFYLNYRRGY